jgi:hypothetical protein
MTLTEVKPTYYERQQELYIESCQRIALELFKHSLVRLPDSNDYECGPFVFTLTDEPVRSPRTIGNREGAIVPGRFKYSVDVLEHQVSGYWDEPDNEVIRSVGTADSLEDAIYEAALALRRQELISLGEVEYWNRHVILEREYADEITASLTN